MDIPSAKEKKVNETFRIDESLNRELNVEMFGEEEENESDGLTITKDSTTNSIKEKPAVKKRTQEYVPSSKRRPRKSPGTRKPTFDPFQSLDKNEQSTEISKVNQTKMHTHNNTFFRKRALDLLKRSNR